MRSGHHIVSLVPDIVWHCGASAPLKHVDSTEPHTEESRRKQVDTHHKETLQTSDTKPSGDVSASVSPKRVPSTLEVITRAVSPAVKSAVSANVSFYMLLGIAV